VRSAAVLFIAAVVITGCGGGDTTVIQTVATETTTQTVPTTGAPPTATQTGTSPGGTIKVINGISDGGVEAPVTATSYHMDMRAWPPFTYDTKIGLSALYLANNPNDCSTATGIAGEDAANQLAQAIERWVKDGTTGGMQIADVMARFCALPANE
jgi:hypothetical protein